MREVFSVVAQKFIHLFVMQLTMSSVTQTIQFSSSGIILFNNNVGENKKGSGHGPIGGDIL